MSTTLARIHRRAARYRDPLALLDFSVADPKLPWIPYELLSLAALPEYAAMSQAERVRLSRVDFARLCATGVWLEGLLMSRATARGFVGAPIDEACVMLQEVREEAGHSLMFLRMIERAGMSAVPLLGPTRLLTAFARRLAPDQAEFWAMVYLGESVTNTFAAKVLRAAAAGAALCPLARQVMALHHHDEAHHLAAARALLEARIAGLGALRRHAFAGLVRALLRRFLEATLYPTPASLRSLGVDDADALARRVRQSRERRALAEACAAPALAFLTRTGLLGATEAA
ncbi:MAG: diiron oxygenase [Burkholderiales bacterium]|nr:diiron oxygenase [Burkholderiales bacterium]